jgi:hypothetical protein
MMDDLQQWFADQVNKHNTAGAPLFLKKNVIFKKVT